MKYWPVITLFFFFCTLLNSSFLRFLMRIFFSQMTKQHVHTWSLLVHYKLMGITIMVYPDMFSLSRISFIGQVFWHINRIFFWSLVALMCMYSRAMKKHITPLYLLVLVSSVWVDQLLKWPNVNTVNKKSYYCYYFKFSLYFTVFCWHKVEPKLLGFQFT